MPRGTNSPSDVFRSVLDLAKKEILQSSEKAATFKHNVIRGDERAESLAHFLREHLPTTFGIGKGEAIDYNDSRTTQLDLIIYDKAGSAPIVSGGNLLIPCEAMYAVVEVKTILTQDELATCYRAAKSVRQLKPFKRSFIPPRAGGADASDKNIRCMYSVFAFETNLASTDWLKKEFERIKLAANENKVSLDHVERITVLSKGMINPCTHEGKACTNEEENIFLEFYIHLMNFLTREAKRRNPVDWQVYSSRNTPGWKKLDPGVITKYDSWQKRR